MPKAERYITAPLVLGIKLAESRRFRPIPQILAWAYFTGLTLVLAAPFMVVLFL